MRAIALVLALLLSGCASWTTHTPMVKNGVEKDCVRNHQFIFALIVWHYHADGCDPDTAEKQGWTRKDAPPAPAEPQS